MVFDLSGFASELGWAAAGVCDPKIPESTQVFFQKWLKENKPADQMTYLERRKEERLQPELYFEGAKTILCFGSYYFRGWAEGEIKISNYAWDRDYHLVLKEKLEMTAAKLQERLGPFKFRLAVDTAPLLEKTLASKAGLGWQGKNTLLINRKFGSFLFLAEMITDLPLDRFQVRMVEQDHCGNCTRCLDACPTQALSPYELHADRCISYLTLEHKGKFTSDTPAFSNWIAGCDICQEVCPWNQKLIPLPSQKPMNLQNLSQSRLEEALSPSNFADWQIEISEKAISYVKPKNWLRNFSHIKKDQSA